MIIPSPFFFGPKGGAALLNNSVLSLAKLSSMSNLTEFLTATRAIPLRLSSAGWNVHSIIEKASQMVGRRRQRRLQNLVVRFAI